MYASSGKFLIYTSRFSSSSGRLRIINSAVARLAKSLGLGIEVASTQKILSVYVYYRNEDGEEIPVYCDWGKNWDEKDVYKAIRNMMFVLSFHPEYTGLQGIRKELYVSA
jgi:hypothetical protein